MGEPAGKLEATPFEIELDQKARGWLTEHPRQGSLVIAYSNKRCCGGAQICDVQLRFEQPTERRAGDLLAIGTVAGREVLMDRRIAARMPRRLPLTVRGMGPLKGLSLDLTGDDWARVLYS